MSDSRDLSPEILLQYVAGALDPATERQVEAALETSDRQRAYVAGLRAALQAEDIASPPSLDDARGELFARIGAHESQLKHRWSPRTARAHLLWRAAIGIAGLSLLIGMFAVFARRSTSDTSPQHYVTRVGQRSLVTLADGSTVMLAPSTSVTVTPALLSVVGEAYVSVAPNASRAFRVRTENAEAQILGTRFLVRQYPDEAVSRVVVEEGRVAVRSLQYADARHGRAIVSARMLAQVSDSGVTVSSDIDLREHTAWTRGSLVFKRVPLGDVVVELSRVYGADIRVADSLLAHELISTELDVSQLPLTKVLLIIGKTMDARFVKTDNVFMLVWGRRGGDVLQKNAVPENFPQPEKMYGR